jgi:hypothetical protein
MALEALSVFLLALSLLHGVLITPTTVSQGHYGQVLILGSPTMTLGIIDWYSHRKKWKKHYPFC